MAEGEERECKICGRVFEMDRSKGHRGYRCNSCIAKEKRVRRKERLVEEHGGECEDCGYDECITALCFHHRNEEEKEFNISASSGQRAWDKLVEEAKKCDLLCANCHQKRHCDLCDHEGV